MASPSLSVPLAARTPRVEDFALLFGLDSAVRGLLMSVVPIAMYRAWGEGTTVSAFFLLSGLVSLMAGLLVPWVTRRLRRRRVMVGAGLLYLLAMGMFATGDRWLVAAAVAVFAVGTVSFWVTLSSYVLDWVPREELGRNESMRLLYGAAAWTFGPFAGVLLLNWWGPAPFVLAAGFAALLIATFLRLGLAQGKARRAAPVGNPLAFVGRFARRPRLIAGWLFAVIRSCGWWVFITYLPLFCLQNGLGETVGGAAVSASSAALFLTPWFLRVVQRLTVRRAVRGAFGWCALFFLAAGALSWAPWATVACLALGAVGLVMLDVCGSLPFLMAVKPSERTEMAAVYSTFRDVSGILSPAIGGAILLVAPVAATFAACGAGMAAAWALAGTVHPRLGERRGPAG